LQRVLIHPPGGPIELEVDFIGAARADARLIVFLHEGLGSMAGWGDWPRTLCEATGCRGLVFSRFGYGHSQGRPKNQDWPLDYLDVEAHDHLPALFAALGIDPARERPILFGHSDGGTITLQYAAAFPQAPEAIIVLAPHVIAEEIAQTRIARMREGWQDGRLRTALTKLHDDPEGVFMGWSGYWLAPETRNWDIADTVATIRCPTLAIQGAQDQYGTLEQLAQIKRQVPHAELLVLEGCRHIPHEEQPEAVRDAVVEFLSRLPQQGC
jgi:pimeloyl-ACP methyl ester carboxylesterase